MPSLRLTGPGITIWPFVETLVCMVRQSYLKIDSFENGGGCSLLCPITSIAPESSLAQALVFVAGLIAKLPLHQVIAGCRDDARLNGEFARVDAELGRGIKGK